MNRPVLSPRSLGQAYLFAFGGGGGGPGRSTLAGEFARLLGQREQQVLFVDAHPDVPTAQERLDAQRSPAVPDPEAPLADRVRATICGTSHAGVDLLSLACVGAGERWDEAEIARLVRVLREVHYEYVILDLPSDASELSTALFVSADVPIHVTTTEPVSLAAGSGFLRAAIRRALELDCDDDTFAALAAIFDGLPNGWLWEDLVHQCAIEGVERHALERMRRFESYLLLNQARDSAERELTGVLALAWYRLLGHRPRAVGAIVFDERRWFHLRQGIPSPTLNSDLGIGVQFTETMRALQNLDELDELQPRRAPWPPSDGFEMLGVAPSLPPGEIRAVYRRLWEGLRRESTVARRQLSAEQRTDLLRDLEARFVEVQTTLNEHRGPTGAQPTVAASAAAPHPGDAIVRRRQELRVTQRELSLRTRIGVRELDAIERFEVDSLPRAVYLRGYLQEIAQVLDVETNGLVRSYLDALEERRRKRILRSR